MEQALRFIAWQDITQRQHAIRVLGGEDFIREIAGYLEDHDDGLDFIQIERKHMGMIAKPGRRVSLEHIDPTTMKAFRETRVLRRKDVASQRLKRLWHSATNAC